MNSKVECWFNRTWLSLSLNNNYTTLNRATRLTKPEESLKNVDAIQFTCSEFFENYFYHRCYSNTYLILSFSYYAIIKWAYYRFGNIIK